MKGNPKVFAEFIIYLHNIYNLFYYSFRPQLKNGQFHENVSLTTKKYFFYSRVFTIIIA